MKRNNTTEIFKFENLFDGNLALKQDRYEEEIQKENEEYEKPRVLVLKPKKSNKIFCGCWQVANQQDAC